MEPTTNPRMQAAFLCMDVEENETTMKGAKIRSDNVRIIFDHCYRYGRWVSNRAGERSGPWCIQWAWNPGIGTSFKAPLPQHRNFPTRKAADVVRKTIRGVWGQVPAIEQGGRPPDADIGPLWPAYG